MKIKINVLLLAFLSLTSTNIYAQSTQQAKTPLIIGEVIIRKSNILNEERTLNIYLPQQYDSSKVYPVMYILDGSINEDFLHIAGLIQFFNMQFKMPDFIVVGVANVDRKRDFTFHTNLKDLQTQFPTTGHSDAFINYIEKELQPLIEKRYKTNAIKYIIGQSLGGLLAAEILLKKPQLFSHYLIVSPSIWWDNESLLQQQHKSQADADIYVSISVGKKEGRMMLSGTKKLKKKLIHSKNPNLKIDFNLMPKENHATILHNSVYAALLKLYPYKVD